MGNIKAGVHQLFLREEELRKAIELLLFSYRNFIGEADDLLESVGLARTHYRVLYFVAQNQGISVSDLAEILCIAKQNLSRVLSQLVREGYIAQNHGLRDRRQRFLELTPKGNALEQALSARHCRRVARAYRAAGGEAVEGFRKVMMGLIAEGDRGRFLSGGMERGERT